MRRYCNKRVFLDFAGCSIGARCRREPGHAGDCNDMPGGRPRLTREEWIKQRNAEQAAKRSPPGGTGSK